MGELYINHISIKLLTVKDRQKKKKSHMLHGVLKTKRKKEQIVVYTSPPLHPCISHLELTGRMKNFFSLEPLLAHMK